MTDNRDLRIPKELAQAILTYLTTKPWIEVKDFIPALMAIQPIDDGRSLLDDKVER